jgi:flavin reductase (DIM6/NTAB) family NADH-FMN oxidoreductase RutF
MDGGKVSQMQTVDPAADPRAFRDALGCFATGVTVVTCPGPDGPMGITANSFSSVSLDPPLVLWSPAKASKRFDAFCTAQRFAIHILEEDQDDLAMAFTRSKDPFGGLDWAPDRDGVPIIAGPLARLDCALEVAHDAGDHAIVVGRVLRCTRRDGAPLVFHGGRFGGFRTGA